MSSKEKSVIKILIAAMGGEGGGVMTKLLTDLAERNGYVARYTYIPGVAQRTGATTYYLELFPRPENGAGPIHSALMPCPGDVDLLLATEPLEAGRAMQMGYVTKDRTAVIASTHRSYSIQEKMAMGDGRQDLTPILRALEDRSRVFHRFDMAACAAEAGCVINAVLMGALAGSGLLPFSRHAFEEAISAGRAAEANRRGFELGFAVINRAPTADKPEKSSPAKTAARMEDGFPPEAHEVLALGLARLTIYQDSDYADRYLRRLDRVLETDRAVKGDKHGFALTRETGRWLVRLMAYDDIVRVAELKTRPERFARIRNEVRAAPDQIIRVTDYLKPGMEEMVSILPPNLAERLLAFSERTGFMAKGWKLKLNSSSVSGFLAMRFLAGLKRRRPKSYRFDQEQRMIERWLAAVLEMAERDYAAALELAACARLIKGYGQTHCRGTDNFQTILDAAEEPGAAARLRALREAALADEAGRAFQEALTADAAE